ncbi:MAG: diguanylate cyclase [Gammaproteobacteria bacterium]|nr:diguanylate cyclase [Gammaproteobacteria bacterium]
MNKETAEALVLHFAQKYLVKVLPQDTFKYLDMDKALEHQLVQEWDSKIAMHSHWSGVVDIQNQQAVNDVVDIFKQALLNKKQLWLQYEGRDQSFHYNPFGLVVRDQQCFFIGSVCDNKVPFLLAARKIQQIQLTDDDGLSSEADFDLDTFSSHYLNHPQSSPEVIEELVVEFPASVYSYVKNHPLQCASVALTEPEGHPAYFKLTATQVINSARLHQWLSGFHDRAHILQPFSLKKIVNVSYIDQLTHLYNRKGFDRQLQRAIEKYYREAQSVFSVLVIDVDKFKVINDDNGHIVGDQVLTAIADCLRQYDAIRYGGEEFVVALELDCNRASTIAERIRTAVAALSIATENGLIQPTISIGIAEFPAHLSLTDKQKIKITANRQLPVALKLELIKSITDSADKALYQAKEQGRNRCVIAESGY